MIIPFYLLLKIYLIAYFFTTFLPLQRFINNFFTNYFIDNEFDGSFKHTTLDAVWTVLGCLKCFAFWLTLAITFNVFFAILLTVIADQHKKFID